MAPPLGAMSSFGATPMLNDSPASSDSSSAIGTITIGAKRDAATPPVKMTRGALSSIAYETPGGTTAGTSKR